MLVDQDAKQTKISLSDEDINAALNLKNAQKIKFSNFSLLLKEVAKPNFEYIQELSYYLFHDARSHLTTIQRMTLTEKLFQVRQQKDSFIREQVAQLDVLLAICLDSLAERVNANLLFNEAHLAGNSLGTCGCARALLAEKDDNGAIKLLAPIERQRFAKGLLAHTWIQKYIHKHDESFFDRGQEYAKLGLQEGDPFAAYLLGFTFKEGTSLNVGSLLVNSRKNITQAYDYFNYAQLLGYSPALYELAQLLFHESSLKIADRLRLAAFYARESYFCTPSPRVIPDSKSILQQAKEICKNAAKQSSPMLDEYYLWSMGHMQSPELFYQLVEREPLVLFYHFADKSRFVTSMVKDNYQKCAIILGELDNLIKWNEKTRKEAPLHENITATLFHHKDVKTGEQYLSQITATLHKLHNEGLTTWLTVQNLPREKYDILFKELNSILSELSNLNQKLQNLGLAKEKPYIYFVAGYDTLQTIHQNIMKDLRLQQASPEIPRSSPSNTTTAIS